MKSFIFDLKDMLLKNAPLLSAGIRSKFFGKSDKQVSKNKSIYLATKPRSKPKSTKPKGRTILGMKLEESYAGLVLGGIIVVVLGLFVANYFSRNKGDIGTAERTTQQQQQEETKPAAGKKYKVVAGDSLSEISKKTYNDENFWPVVAQANKISNPDLIFADTDLEIPARADAEKLLTSLTAKDYQVAEGDTLFTISEKVYGDGSQWQKIADANSVGTLANGNPLIFTGTTLLIPR